MKVTYNFQLENINLLHYYLNFEFSYSYPVFLCEEPDEKRNTSI